MLTAVALPVHLVAVEDQGVEDDAIGILHTLDAGLEHRGLGRLPARGAPCIAQQQPTADADQGEGDEQQPQEQTPGGWVVQFGQGLSSVLEDYRGSGEDCAGSARRWATLEQLVVLVTGPGEPAVPRCRVACCTRPGLTARMG